MVVSGQNAASIFTVKLSGVGQGCSRFIYAGYNEGGATEVGGDIGLVISTTLQIITIHRSKYEAKSTKTRELVKSFLLCLGYVLSSMPYTFAIKHLGTQAQSGICLGTGQIICLYFSV